MRKPKRYLFAALALPFALLFTSCSTATIHVDAIAGSVEIVSDRHDAYVEGDDSLSDDDRRIFLRSTELLRRIIEEAQKQ